MAWEEWLYAHVVVFTAFVLRGLTGFGTALVMAPLLTLFLDLKRTAVITAVLSVLNGVGLAYALRRDVVRRTFFLTSAGALVGLALGTYLLVTQPGALLKRGVGLLTVLFSIGLFRRGRRASGQPRLWPESAGAVAGLLGGVLGGLFGTSGPPMIVYLSRRGVGIAAFRATLIAFFCVVDFIRFFGYAASGLLTRQLFLTCVLLVPASFLGSYVGTKIYTRVNERAVRVVVAVSLAVTGAVLTLGR
ncbi:sulfite exporter TauE/SafE family protein [bacterium]|nr:sulfite exporter TauE/SafE family protein [bacterium]